MATVNKAAQAGTLESSDMLVSIAPAPNGSGIKLELVSATMLQYGDHIKALITRILHDAGVTDAEVQANDKGAVDWVIEARVKTAIARAAA
ncbi:MAG: Citrate lyase acyl carrier protein [Desulfovibrio sp.]